MFNTFYCIFKNKISKRPKKKKKIYFRNQMPISYKKAKLKIIATNKIIRQIRFPSPPSLNASTPPTVLPINLLRLLEKKAKAHGTLQERKAPIKTRQRDLGVLSADAIRRSHASSGSV